jgi:glucose/arabinose dehydrogenase
MGLAAVVHAGTRRPVPQSNLASRRSVDAAANVSTEIAMQTTRCFGYALLLMLMGACTQVARMPPQASVGPDPALPRPAKEIVPVVNIAPAKGWPDGGKPVAAAGLRVERFAEGLDHPRWLYVLPNGDVLVAETAAPPKPPGGSLKTRVMKLMMKQAGSAVPSANRVTLLRDANGDGVVDLRTVFLDGLNSPFGMALVGNDFYVANTDAVVRFPYAPGQTRIDARGTKIVELPAGETNRHWTRDLEASADGGKLYVSVGSDSNIAEGGIEREAGRAAVWEIELATGRHRVYASGLRNPVGLATEPSTGALWVTVNERDEIGADLVPDYITQVKEGGFYGWPYSYYGHHVDARVKPQRPDLVATAIVPDYALGNHTASLGLSPARGADLPRMQQGMFVGQHGSWNRVPKSGYKVIFVPFANGRPTAAPIDVLTGFVSPDGYALGRPVGVAIDKHGALLVADDVGNIVWRVTRDRARETASAG